MKFDINSRIRIQKLESVGS